MRFGKVSGAIMAMALMALVGCGGDDSASGGGTPTPPPAPPRDILAVQSTPVATFKSPWAMVFLPDGKMLVTDNQTRELSIVTAAGEILPVTGLPDRLGLYDVALHPAYQSNNYVYLSYAQPLAAGEPRIGRQSGDPALPALGLTVIRGTLVSDARGGRLDNVVTIWRQAPKVVGRGELGARMAFSPDGAFLFITAGDRAEFLPAGDTDNTLGKTIRLYPDGSIPPDNPLVGTAGAKGEIWTQGHRNHYGLAFAPDGRLWSSEMGPSGGDEFNLLKRGANYGWPKVSNGSQYSGEDIPDHAPNDGFEAPVITWTPAIAPAGMIFYTANLFAAWKGDAILAGLQSKGLIRVRTNGDAASEVQRLDMGARIREVEQGPDGAIWVLEDAPTGRLLKLAPQ